MSKKVTYIVSDIDKAVAFEWVATHIDKNKFDLSFILLNSRESYLENMLEKNGVPVKRISCRGKKDWPFAWWKIHKYLRRAQPDIVHCHLLQASVIGLTAAWTAGTKTRIYTRHHSDYHHRYHPKGIWIDKWCNKLSTCIVAPSNVVKEILCKWEHVPEEKIHIIAHGFDMNYFSSVDQARIDNLKKKHQLSSQYPVIGVISRFTELKGIQYIIPAFEKLLIEFPGAVLMLFNARGDYEKQLHRLLKALPQHNYRIIPFEQDIAAAYRLFDIFIQVSTDRTIEAFGQTYIEALASGVPSIFTLAGIAVDFIKDGENALVVPYTDTDAIYLSITRLIFDNVLAETLKENGRASVNDRFSLVKMIDKLENLYKYI